MKTVHKGLLLGILAAAQFIVILDGSIVNVALSSIMEGLNFSPHNLQWIVTAYTLAFGGFLLLGGRAADLFGRRKIFLIGLISFTVASVLAGSANSEIMMIVARVLQGMAAAFMSPAALSIVLTEFKEGNERNRALGVWGAVGAGGAAAGLLLGGLLTQYLGWRWDFFVNVPIGILLTILALKYIPEHRSTADHRHLDLPGALLVTSGLMALVYGLTMAPEWGWLSVPAIAWLGSAVVLLGLFLLNESKSKAPLMPLSIFRIRNVSGANLAQLPILAGLMSMFFFVSLYLQNILDYTPLQTGLSFLPFAVIIAIVTTIISKYVGRVGYKIFMVIGPLVTAVALFMLAQISVEGSYLTEVLPGICLMALGSGMTFVAVTIAATSGVPKHEAGLASGLLNTSQQIGGALGLAILSGIATSAVASSLKAAGSSAGTQQAIAQATVDGYHNALIAAAIFAVTASLISFFVIKQKKIN